MAITKVTEAISEVACKYPGISRIGVFGSCARGDSADDSDVDLLYDYNYHLPDATHQILSFVEDFLNKIKPLEADFVFIENLLESEDENFKENVLNDVIWVYPG